MFKFTLDFTAESPADAAVQLGDWIKGMAGMFGIDAPIQVATVAPVAQQKLEPNAGRVNEAIQEGRRTRGKNKTTEPDAAPPPPPTTTEPPPAAVKSNGSADISREDIIAELTTIFQGGDQDLKDQITEWRNGLGISKLRDMKDAQLPAAAAFLRELAGP